MTSLFYFVTAARNGNFFRLKYRINIPLDKVHHFHLIVKQFFVKFIDVSGHFTEFQGSWIFTSNGMTRRKSGSVAHKAAPALEKHTFMVYII